MPLGRVIDACFQENLEEGRKRRCTYETLIFHKKGEEAKRPPPCWPIDLFELLLLLRVLVDNMPRGLQPSPRVGATRSLRRVPPPPPDLYLCRGQRARRTGTVRDMTYHTSWPDSQTCVTPRRRGCVNQTMRSRKSSRRAVTLGTATPVCCGVIEL